MTTATPSAADPSGPARLHGLDALRAAALGLGIVLHSLIPFAPGAYWMVTDTQTSAAVGIPLVVIHLFRMVLFMLLAGYVGRMVLHRRGAGAYLRDRTVRILLPLVAFWPVSVLTLGVLAGVNAAVRDVPVPTAPPADAPPLLLLFTPGQLWFLLVLMECALVVVAVRAVAVRLAGPERVARVSQRAGALLASPAGVALAALPYVAGLLVQGRAAGGITEPFTVLPEVAPLLTYLGAFLVGWFLHSREGALDRLAATWVQHLVAAVLLTVAVLLLPTAPLGVAALLVAGAGWTWTYGLVGLCSRHLTRERPVVRYLADASYWMYLLHLPLLVGVGIVLADLTWPIPVKLLVTWAVTAAVLLLTYDLLVRDTVLGRWLNGRRRPRALRRRAEAASAPRS